MKTILKYYFALIIIFFMSCSTEDGTDGIDGNANVISSGWIAISPSPLPNLQMLRVVSDLNINTENLNNASFQVYARTDSGIVYSIPHEFEDKNYFFTLDAINNEITFRGESNSSSTVVFDDFVEFRYTIIPSN